MTEAEIFNTITAGAARKKEENIRMLQARGFGMRKRTAAVLIALCVIVLLSACGKEKTDVSSLPVEPIETAGENDDVISNDQAFQAVLNYCKSADPAFDGEINAEGYSEYWDVSTNEDGVIVVLYRSYTGAQIRYYVDPVSGETYITELVPGVIDEERKTGETFNVKNYLAGLEQPIEETPEEGSASAPVEYETADGFMSSFLLASDRDLIGTTNDYGDFYRVVYMASLEDDELTVCGSMDYRNYKDQDPITVSSDLTHVFKVNENTVYMKGTETGDVTITKEEFAGLLESRKNSGMFFEVEISDGAVKTAYLCAQ